MKNSYYRIPQPYYRLPAYTSEYYRIPAYTNGYQRTLVVPEWIACRTHNQRVMGSTPVQVTGCILGEGT